MGVSRNLNRPSIEATINYRLQTTKGKPNFKGNPCKHVGEALQSGKELERLEVFQEASHKKSGVELVTICGEKFVLKKYKVDQLDPVRHAQLKREISSHGSELSQHPNIVAMLACWAKGNDLNMLFEWMEKGDVFPLVNFDEVQGVDDEQIAAEVIRDVASALKEMHSHNVLHRDIKLENIFAGTRNGHTVYKIGDLGFCINCAAERAVTRLGTLELMSPEVLRGASKRVPEDGKDKPELEYGPEVDIWSLGCVLFELLHGRSPFTGRDRREVLAAIERGPVFNPSVSEESLDLCKQMLHRDRTQRITAAGILEHPFIANMGRPKDGATRERWGTCPGSTGKAAGQTSLEKLQQISGGKLLAQTKLMDDFMYVTSDPSRTPDKLPYTRGSFLAASADGSNNKTPNKLDLAVASPSPLRNGGTPILEKGRVYEVSVPRSPPSNPTVNRTPDQQTQPPKVYTFEDFGVRPPCPATMNLNSYETAQREMGDELAPLPGPMRQQMMERRRETIKSTSSEIPVESDLYASAGATPNQKNLRNFLNTHAITPSLHIGPGGFQVDVSSPKGDPVAPGPATPTSTKQSSKLLRSVKSMFTRSASIKSIGSNSGADEQNGTPRDQADSKKAPPLRPKLNTWLSFSAGQKNPAVQKTESSYSGLAKQRSLVEREPSLPQAPGPIKRSLFSKN